MMRYIILLLFSIQSLFAGFEQSGASARAKALAGAYTGISDDAWAIFYNVGGLTQLHNDEVSFFYAPQLFGLSELSTGIGAAAFRTSFGTIGFGVRKYGYDLYREISGTLSYATNVSGISAGVSINYQTVSISRYGSAHTISIDIGTLVPISQHIRWGVSAKNINAATIGGAREKLPQTFAAGVLYSPLTDLFLSVDFNTETGFDPSTRFGFEYNIIDAIALRAGYTEVPSEITGGLGVRYSRFRFDYAVVSHQDLGWTHEVSITIELGGSHE
jgi:hypothetical protein